MFSFKAQRMLLSVGRRDGAYSITSIVEGENCVLRNLVITGSGTHWSAIVLQNSSPTLEQLTIVENYVGISATEADPIIRNCIFWGNSQGDLEDCQAHYSCLEDVDVGDGNIDREPLFVDPN